MHACRSLCIYVSMRVMQKHAAIARWWIQMLCESFWKRDRSSWPARQDCKLSLVIALLQQPCKACIELNLIVVSVFVG
jgi:hypothetical protein